MSASAFVLVDAILPIGNHTISEYLRFVSSICCISSSRVAKLVVEYLRPGGACEGERAFLALRVARKATLALLGCSCGHAWRVNCEGSRAGSGGVGGRDRAGARTTDESDRGGKDSPVAFRAGPVELEFDVAFTASGGADVGVRVWVISVGAKGELSRTATNRLKVTLTPVDREGKDKLIGDVGKKDISTK